MARQRAKPSRTTASKPAGSQHNLKILKHNLNNTFMADGREGGWRRWWMVPMADGGWRRWWMPRHGEMPRLGGMARFGDIARHRDMARLGDITWQVLETLQGTRDMAWHCKTQSHGKARSRAGQTERKRHFKFQNFKGNKSEIY